MEMSGRPRRALHQRSDSETNEIRTIPSLHSNNSSISNKANDVSSWVPHPTTASISRDSTRSSSRTASTSKKSLDSLPPVVPLKINKRDSFIVSRDPPTPPPKESLYLDTLTGSNSPLDGPPIKAQTFPKSILKKPSRAALPPYSAEEYNERSSSWVVRSSQSPTTADRFRMNSRTLRIVHSDESDDEEEAERMDVVGGLASRERSVTETFSSRPSPSVRLSGRSEPGTETGFTSTDYHLPTRPQSHVSVERPGTAGSLFVSAKQLPTWARYFYGKRGGRGSIIEPDMPRNSGAHVSDGSGRADNRIRRQESDDSLLITEVILPDAAYHTSRHFPSTESIPGIDWIGNRTRIVDSEIATQWSTPHLTQAPLSRSETIDRQVVMFCLGFVLPICWIIAAFLPLPEFHTSTKEQPYSTTGEVSSLNVDVEAGPSHSVDVERRYKNARWWRKVNRMLSVVGLAIIGAIIALVAVAATRGV